MNETSNDLPLPDGIRARMIDNGNGLSMHVLEAGFDIPGRPCIVLLHGFPELAYSWRKIMKPLADAGFHVVAPDQRGYGRTIGGIASFDTDLDEFTFPNLVRDVLGLVSALGYRRVASVIGHDFGSPVAAWCALIRPDVFASVVMMSAPFAGPPAFAFNTANDDARLARVETAQSIMAEAVAGLASLDPPRKHYQWYYSSAGRPGRSGFASWPISAAGSARVARAVRGAFPRSRSLRAPDGVAASGSDDDTNVPAAPRICR